MTLEQMRDTVCQLDSLRSLEEYVHLTQQYLLYLAQEKPTQIISPSNQNYRFFQYGEQQGFRITRPLNYDLFQASAKKFQVAASRFVDTLEVLGKSRKPLRMSSPLGRFTSAGGVDSVVYTVQQSIGAVADSLADSNQARKRVGQLFEALVNWSSRGLALSANHELSVCRSLGMRTVR